MIKISNQGELLEAFRPQDREEVELPLGLRFPLGLSDYIAWAQPAGCRTYLVFVDPSTAKAMGVVFRSDQPGGDSAAAMCEWCHAVRPGDGIKLLTARSSSKRRVGISLCKEVSCKEKALAEPGVNDMPIGDTPRERMAKIVERMANFARRNLF